MNAVLFDLDGTLLDIDLELFLGRYFKALSRVAADLAGGADIMPAIHGATRAMMEEHPGRTNEQVFAESFERLTGLVLSEVWPVFDTFYREEFPAFGDGMTGLPGARDAVETALGLGMKVAVATNPIFPEVAIRHRMAWAGVGDLPVHLVTTYERMHACKPHAAYYRETAEMLGVSPTDCMMVGDDRVLDMSAADVGMRTYLRGRSRGCLCRLPR